jgi:ParB family chromosome partitioning protein
MARGNRSFVQGLAGTLPPAARAYGRVPACWTSAKTALADLATGTSVTRLQELVDPAQCRIWEAHHRDYAALNPDNCADLIDSLKAEGRQNFPAIVRRAQGDPHASVRGHLRCLPPLGGHLDAGASPARFQVPRQATRTDR